MLESFKNSLWALLYIFIGWLLGLLSAEFNFKKTRELEKKKTLQAKIEELAELVDRTYKEDQQIWIEIPLFKEINLENIKRLMPFVIDPSHKRVRIMIDFYFPELKTEYEELINNHAHFMNQVLYLAEEKNQANREKILEEGGLALDEVKKVCDRMISSSSKIAQKLL